MEMMQLDTMMIELHSTSNTSFKVRETQPENIIQSKKLNLLMMLTKILSKDTLRATQIVMKIIEQCVGCKSINECQ